MTDPAPIDNGEERDETAPAGPAEIRARHESNRRGWNEGAAFGYTPEVENTIDFLRQGGSNLHPVERSYLAEILPNVDLAIHLQCASGKDTLSLLNEGVKKSSAWISPTCTSKTPTAPAPPSTPRPSGTAATCSTPLTSWTAAPTWSTPGAARSTG